jgi:hypothetical protein
MLKLNQQKAAQHGVPHALPGALRRGRARRKMGILMQPTRPAAEVEHPF